MDYSQSCVTPFNAKSLDDLPPTLLVTNGLDPLRDVGNRYAKRLSAKGNAITCMHHPRLTHGFIQFIERLVRCRKATVELAGLRGGMLARG